jgi:hypothetical protein
VDPSTDLSQKNSKNYLQNDTVLHCFQDSGGPPGICRIPGAIFEIPGGLKVIRNFFVIDSRCVDDIFRSSTPGLYLVTEKKMDFCGFRFPDGHKVAS